MKMTKSLWGVTALCAAMLLAIGPLEAKGGGGAGGSNGSVAAGGSGDVGGGGSANLNANASSTNKDGNGNANGNANGGGKGTNGKSKAATTSNTNVTAANKGGRLVVKVVASGTAQADGTQGNNNAQAGGGGTLTAKAVGGTSKPKAMSTSDSTKVVVVNGKVKVVEGTTVYVDNNGHRVVKVACDGNNCSGAISTGGKVKAFSFHADEDWDGGGGGLFAATKTAGYVSATATRHSVNGRGSFFAGAVAGGGNSGAIASAHTGAFAMVRSGGPKKSTTSVRASGACSNTFLQTHCVVRVKQN
ncbi:MAG: hypothetical protein KBD50_01400 [Candidatus Pacebacteria bacterium]|nr:hypothetical protein [Candidatus Paceibacterota bacterium]